MNTNEMNNILKFSLNILYFGAGDVKFNVHTGTVASSMQFTIHQHRCQERVLGIKRPEKQGKDITISYIIDHYMHMYMVIVREQGKFPLYVTSDKLHHSVYE